jgi:hypothetical protein
MPGLPYLEHLKRTKKLEGNALLLPAVEEWLVKNGDKLDSFDAADYNFLQQLIIIGTTRDASVFSPSGASMCQRSQIIDKFPKLRKSKITKIDPKLRQIFDDGKWRHIRWQMLFFKMGIVESAEGFMSKGALKFGGSFDLILNLPWVKNKRKRRVVVDIKGTNAAQFIHIRNTGKALFKHELQVQIYMYLTGCRVAIIWYENKNNQDVCEVVVPYNLKIIRRAIARQKRMSRYVKVGAFPKEECSVGDNSDSMFRQCANRLTCQRLPIHFITKDKTLIKTHGPRIIDKKYSEYDLLPVISVSGRLANRKISKKE